MHVNKTPVLPVRAKVSDLSLQLKILSAPAGHDVTQQFKLKTVNTFLVGVTYIQLRLSSVRNLCHTFLDRIMTSRAAES